MVINENLQPVPGDGSRFRVDDDGRTLLINRAGEWEKWQRFDPQSGKFYKMIFIAAGKPPTVEISGIKMHVTKDSDPSEDTARKLHALGRIRGAVLDTCCGLGYTAGALAALSEVESVVCIEKDPNMLALCRENPFSRSLFESPKIHLLEGDSATLITTFPDGQFDAILRDPPRFSLAPELYEEAFYRECRRVLRYRGRIYHYTGDPNRETRKRSLPERTVERFKKAGFSSAKLVYQGVLAVK